MFVAFRSVPCTGQMVFRKPTANDGNSDLYQRYRTLRLAQKDVKICSEYARPIDYDDQASEVREAADTEISFGPFAFDVSPYGKSTLRLRSTGKPQEWWWFGNYNVLSQEDSSKTDTRYAERIVWPLSFWRRDSSYVPRVVVACDARVPRYLRCDAITSLVVRALYSWLLHRGRNVSDAVVSRVSSVRLPFQNLSYNDEEEDSVRRRDERLARADVVVSFAPGRHFSSPSSTLAHADARHVHLNEDIVFSDGAPLVTSIYERKTFCAHDLQAVLLHEFGHVFGVSHADNENSIMYPYLLKRRVGGAQDASASNFGTEEGDDGYRTKEMSYADRVLSQMLDMEEVRAAIRRVAVNQRGREDKTIATARPRTTTAGITVKTFVARDENNEPTDKKTLISDNLKKCFESNVEYHNFSVREMCYEAVVGAMSRLDSQFRAFLRI